MQKAKVPIQKRTKDSLSAHVPISSHTTRKSDSVVTTGPSTQEAGHHRVSAFLSARKRRRIETESEMSTIPALSFSEAADQNASLFADTQVALTGKDCLTPFTKLATSEKVPAPTSIFTTKGIRSKVNLHTEADALWAEKVSVCVCTHNVFITITVHLRTFCLLTE